MRSLRSLCAARKGGEFLSLSQVPMVVLMVAYTMTSLWILALPVVG